MNKLSEDQIKQRLQEGRNYKRLYTELKVRYDDVTGQLEKENKELRQLVADQQARLESQAIQIAELQTMVFGKKRKPPSGGHRVPDLPKPEPKPRDESSYRRPTPPATAITATVPVPVDRCACGGELTGKTEHNRYVEDIPLPGLTEAYQARLVTKYVVERGICNDCGKPASGRDLGGAVVALGPNVRLLVTHLTTILGMSYSGVARLLLSLYGITVTDGEIANILARQHRIWRPVYEQLLADIRAAPAAHADESSWPIQSLQGAGYAWNLSDATSPKVCYALTNSRGVMHAKQLFGQDTGRPFRGIRISDDYGAYRGTTLPGSQQLCWAHLYRSIRDLRYNANLPEQQLPYVCKWYEQFAAIYEDLRMYLDEPYDTIVRETQATELWQRLQALLPPSHDEPQKLTLLKAQLTRAGKDRLLTCLPSQTPCDNNRAERDLRQLVLKRKRCFGSKTEKGAQALSTVLSVCTTTWRTNPDNYFSTLAALA